jgi:ATP-binding cassette subfamily B multidrug efflux pump
MKDFRRFFAYFRSRPRPYVWGFLTMAGSTAFFLAMPRLVGQAIQALSSRDIEFEMRGDLFAHLLRLPPVWYRKNRVGDLMSRAVNDLAAVRMMIGPGIMQGGNTILVGSAAIVLMFLVSPYLSLVALSVLPAVAIATKVVGQATHRRFTKIQEFFSEVSAEAQENFSGARLVRAFAREAEEEARFDPKNRELRRRNLGLARLNALYLPMLRLIVEAGFALTLWAGGLQIIAGKLTVAKYVEFNLYLMEMIWPAMALGWVVNLWQRGAASWNRMLDVWEASPLPEERDAGEPLSGGIEVRNLSFSYEGGRPILSSVSFSVPAGRTVALVGRTGAGKSTFLSLLLRIDEPPAGTILVGGRDVTDLPLPLLRRSVAAVPQETFLFSDTLAGNVAFGRPGASRSEIEQAVRAAGLQGDLERFPKGLDTVVGERGITLSGGQKQRMALARALLTEASILILDDAFSSVDTETEARILAGLKDATTGRTVLLVSHRLSTLRNADLIVVLDGGRVAETGTHDELLARKGVYAALAERQRLAEEAEAA